VFVGTSEVRASPIATTGSDGLATFPILAGHHTLTVRARGYGAQPLAIDVAAQKPTAQTIPLAADVAHPFNGAKVIFSTGGDPTLALDDTLATVWSVPATRAQDAGGTQSFVLRVAGDAPVRLHALQVGSYSRMKSAFDSLRDFTVDLSEDGRVWRHAVHDEFKGQKPAPSVTQLGMRRYDLKEPVMARYLRFSGRPQRPGPGTLAVAEIEAFGDAPGRGELKTGARFHDQGTILLETQGQPTRGLMQLPGFCGPKPPVEGITAHVTTLPAGFNDGYHRIRVTGEAKPGQPGAIDVDVTYLSRECNFLGASAGPSSENATIPRHTKYVVTENAGNIGTVLVRVDAFE
jgi:hypothetical protein